jgi:hypothetical protein
MVASAMRLKTITVTNFRLLHDVCISLEPTTAVVGRNNSGKTSLTEVIKRIFSESGPSFRLEDFSFCAYMRFWEAFIKFSSGSPEADVRKILPTIEVHLTFAYDKDQPLDTLSDFVIDLNPDCTEALVVFRYGLKDGKLGTLFADLINTNEGGKKEFFRALRERIPSLFGSTFLAVDPSDPTNEKIIEGNRLQVPKCVLWGHKARYPSLAQVKQTRLQPTPCHWEARWPNDMHALNS